MKKVVTTDGSTRRGAVPAWIDQRVLLALGILAVLAVAGHAAAPAWWAARGILTGRPANDYAVANQGQLKNMAKAARAELVAQGFFQATDANALNTLVNGWSASNESAMDYAPASLGQLKAVAKPFYDALHLDYPWPAASPAANDYAVANIGQIKAVFAFPIAPFDSDSDGLPDGWERKMFDDLDQGAADDFDDDGLTESQEFALGTSPIAADSDADGMPDAWEHSHTLNPRDATDAGPAQGRVERPEEPILPQAEDHTHDYGNGPIFDSISFSNAMTGYDAAMTDYYSVVGAADHIDPDKDGLSNLREHLAGTNPRTAFSDGDLYSDDEELMYGSDPLATASIPPVRAEFSQAGPSLLKVSTFRGDHAVGGEDVTVVGSPDTLFLSTGPGSVLTPGQITVTTDPVLRFATVYVFAPAGAGGAQSSGVAVGGTLAGTPFSILSNRWRGTLALTQDPELPGPSQSTPPAEGILFTAHRERRIGYNGRQHVSPQTEEYGDPSPMGEQWFKPGGGTPPYSDDGFNGDADLQGDNTDPGDPRDGISTPTGAPVPASPGEKWAYRVETGGGRSTRIVGPYGSPTGMTGSYTASNAYNPPDKAESSGSSFIYAQAVAKLASMSYSRGDNTHGWQGNGPLGVKAYTVTSTWAQGTAAAPTVTWVDEGSGQTQESSATYLTESASMQQMEVRLQTNKDVEAGKPRSATFLLTKTTVEGANTTNDFVATLRLTINSGRKSDTCEVLSGTLPAADVTAQGGVVAVRSPEPQAGKMISHNLLPLIEIMQHPADVTSGSSDPPATQSLRLCRWLDAYDSSGNLATNYPRDDRDRIRIKIPAVLFPGQDKITVKIATKKPAGTDDPEDATTDLELDKIGESFISKPIILVGDGMKAGYSGDDAWDKLSPQDEQANDPTHVASPGGKVEITLPLSGGLKIEFQIAKYISKVRVQSYVVRSPSSDTANILTHVNEAIRRAKDVYKQAHIKIEHQGLYDCVLTDAELDLINSDRGDGPRMFLLEGNNANYLDADESQFVFDKIRELDGGGTDFVRLIYMDCDFLDGDKKAVAITMRDQFTGTNKYGVYEGCIVIPIKNASDTAVPAHEIGHALTLLHPKDQAFLEGGNTAVANTPELPYMLMFRGSTKDWVSHTEYYGKRFVKKDLNKLSASPRPLFILPFP